MTLIGIIDLIFTIALILLILRLILELVSARRGHPLVAAILSITEPLVRPFRGMIRSSREDIVATILAIIAVLIVRYLVVALIGAVLPRPGRG